MNWKRPLALSTAALTLGTALAACGNPTAAAPDPTPTPAAEVQSLSTTGSTVKAPKYVFLFIGDGMSYPQIQSTSDFLGALNDADYRQAQPSLDDNGGAILDGPEYLNFMNFEAAGSAVTYDSNSFAPDSASTATSISTGYKTYSGSINVDETGTISYETIAEQLHAQKGYSVGVITSVNLNHATPAAFYAHQASRNDYYDIGLELIDSGFEYFAGGGLLKPTGAEGDQADLYALAEKAGYHVVKTQAEAEQVTGGPVVIIDEHLADSDAMAYEIDRTDDMWALADYVEKGIEVLSQDKDGFFMMCEGGKIDWACHANDAASSIHDTQALADAVQVAIDFAKEHADETLILVTGDHETGGLTIGFQAARYAMELLELDFSADEDVVCIAENDACGVDAIQVLLGCSVGKGNLLFHLRGKQAFSFYNRKTGKAVRLVLRPTPAEYQTKEERFRYLQDAAPAALFDVKPAVLALPERARLFQSHPCDGCGEVTAEHLLRLENGKKLCLDCFRAYNRFDV